MESFSKIIAIIITVIFIFIVPITYFAEKQDVITQAYVENEVVAFVDNVRAQGKITQEMYNDFVFQLDQSGLVYDVKMEHSHRTLDPIYNNAGEFTNGTTTNVNLFYEEDIWYSLYEKKPTETELAARIIEGEYHFTKGDYFTVSVVNAEKTFATKLKELLLSFDMAKEQILATYGGEIRDENY